MAYKMDIAVAQVLTVCEKTEFACADIYHFFANQFKEEREIFYIWLKSALERENRARLFALVGKLRLDDVIEGALLDLDQAQAILNQVRELEAKVKKEPPTVREALEMAMELERMLDVISMEKVVQFTESYQKWFLAIMNRDQMELLQNAYEQFGK